MYFGSIICLIITHPDCNSVLCRNQVLVYVLYKEEALHVESLLQQR